mmetsp:Transcript_25564/g.46145  ORF Transcript_25564/g.46145 Transcript_25564/m.46145 type:complete len:98 (+) Transcript_25564:131-424(+)
MDGVTQGKTFVFSNGLLVQALGKMDAKALTKKAVISLKSHFLNDSAVICEVPGNDEAPRTSHCSSSGFRHLYLDGTLSTVRNAGGDSPKAFVCCSCP